MRSKRRLREKYAQQEIKAAHTTLKASHAFCEEKIPVSLV